MLRGLLWACLAGLFAASPVAAAPMSLTQMSNTDFATWIMGTEWEWSTKGGKRRIWFATPGVVIYTRMNESGSKAASAFSWGVTKKGEARFFHETSDKRPYDVVISDDLKTARITDVKNKDIWKAPMTGRRVLPAAPNMKDEEFKTWLKGKTIQCAERAMTFPDAATIRTQTTGEARSDELKIIRPGLVYHFWKGNTKDPTLIAFSTDLKTARFWVWWGTQEGEVTDGPPRELASKVKPKTQPAQSSGKGSAVTMTDLKPVKMAGKAAAVNALLIQELGSSKYAGKASALSLSALELEGDKPATIGFNQNVGAMMQKALQEVARFHAIRQGGWPRANEMQLSFEDKFTGKDGPSAAVACALLLESVIKGTELDPAFAVTGDLNADGSVQPIGGVHAKLRGATNLKCKLLGIPQKNAIHAMDIYHTEGLKPFLGIQVFAFSKFDEALDVARLGKPPALTAAISDFTALTKAAAAAPNSLRAPDAIAKLQSIIQRAPTHLSARVLLLYATDKLPRTLSPAGTLAEIDQATGDLETAIRGDLTAKTKLDGGQVARARSGLQRLRPLADARVRPLVDAWVAWGNLADKFVKNNGPRDEKDVKEWIATVNRIGVEEEKLRTNEGFREELE